MRTDWMRTEGFELDLHGSPPFLLCYFPIFTFSRCKILAFPRPLTSFLFILQFTMSFYSNSFNYFTTLPRMTSSSSNRSSTDELLQMDVHSSESAIVFRFIQQSEVAGERLKIVQLKGLDERSDPGAIAHFVWEQCQPWMPSNRQGELERLVRLLQRRQAGSGTADSSSSASFPSASLDKLEDYLEMLYDEEGDSKQRGVSLLSELVKALSPPQLEAVARNEQLMGALARTLKEDARRNFELAIQLAQLFHRLSQFAPLHPSLAQWKVGLLSLQLVEQELRRWELWRQQMGGLEGEGPRRKWESAMRKQDQLLEVCLRTLLNLADDLRAEAKMLRKGLLPLLFRALDHIASPQLLAVGLKFVWKLSQFAENQKYMADTPGTVEQLVSLLSLPLLPSELLHSALFPLLFNLSFEPISRRRMVQAGLVSLLAPHLSGGGRTGAAGTGLALMYQLSIVDDAKAMIAFTDCIPTLLRLLFHAFPSSSVPEGEGQKRAMLVRSLLVNIVLEKRNAQLVCGTDGQGLDALMALALDGGGDVLALKIARNIAAHEGSTRELFAKWMPQLLENAIEGMNPLGDDSPGHVSSMESLGICAQIPEAPWTELDERHGVIDFLEKLLKLGVPLSSSTGRKGSGAARRKEAGRAVSDDVLLQAVLLTGTLAQHSLEMAERVEGRLLPLIIATLNNRQEDDELVLQCTFVFVTLLSHGGGLASRICSPHQHLEGGGQGGHTHSVVELLLNLMHDKNAQLRLICDGALHQIAESSPYWRDRILASRFRWHNAQWLEMVEAPEPDPLMLVSNNEAEAMFDQSNYLNNAIPAEFLLGHVPLSK